MRIGVDTGGTFTDVLALGRDGTLRAVKRPSTPRDPAEAVLDGVRRAKGGAAASEVVHSTTVGTNALLERRGGPTALVTTLGFEDVLEIGRQARPNLYALDPRVAPPLIGAAQRLGLDERLDARGRVVRAPDDAALAELAARVRALDVKSVAVCLLHAHVNPEHERAVAAALASLGLPISLSSEVLPLVREYERTSTTAVDAWLVPVVAPYLARLERELGARLRVMLSNGGAVVAAAAARHPVRTVLSGPAAGVVGALTVARAAGVSEVITFDMGGTSTDVALALGGAIATTEESQVAGCPIQLPMLAVHTVGAGGGSIAWRDAGGALKVGPRSAGAEPGPAAYARGGEEATVTDADLVLGRLDPKNFAAGVSLDIDRARAALGRLGAALGGRSPEAAAEDVVAVADAVMARAIRAISVERGLDPANFSLLSFGGAGGLHACAVARELGVRRVLVPPAPGLLCAYGALVADAVHDFARALHADAGARLDAGALDAEFDGLEADAARALDGEAVSPSLRELERSCALRYRGQAYELLVPAEGDLVAAFHAAHRARYGYALDDRAVELVAVRLRAVGRGEPAPPLAFAASEGAGAENSESTAPFDGKTASAASSARHEIIFAGRRHDAALIARAALVPGARVAGPAVIVEYSATTFVPPEAHAEVERGGLLTISL